MDSIAKACAGTARSARWIGLVVLLLLTLGAGAAAAGNREPDREGSGLDLRTGGVFTMTNDRRGNKIVAFARRENGRLARVGSFRTGGTGSGSFEDTADSLVLGTAQGEAAPNNLIEEAELLFVTNARSNSITVFEVRERRLVRVETQESGGEKPVSLTVNGGLLYVLHSGEATDDLFDSEGVAIPNCTTGTPSITGFTVSTDGGLEPIPNSTRRLSGLGGSGCAQISFNPAGTVLAVTERLANDEDAPGPEGDEGVISTYTRNADGTLNGPIVTDATGEGPFGFTFSKAGDLFTTEQSDGPLGREEELRPAIASTPTAPSPPGAPPSATAALTRAGLSSRTTGATATRRASSKTGGSRSIAPRPAAGSSSCQPTPARTSISGRATSP